LLKRSPDTRSPPTGTSSRFAASFPRAVAELLSGEKAIHSYAYLAAYCAGYVLLQGITNFYPLARLAASPWSPETGLTVAASVFFGPIIIPLTMVSHVLADSITRAAPFWTVEMPASVLYALIYAGPGALIGRWLNVFGHDSMRFLVRFIALTIAGAFLFAATQAGLAVVIRQIPIAELISPAFTLAVGDIIGILTVAPLFLLTARDRRLSEYIAHHALALAIGLFAIVAIALVVFGLDITDDFKFFYLLFVPVIALAVVLGLSGAVFAVFVTDASMMAIIYWREISLSTATELQLLMISLSATGLVLGAVVHERGIFKEALTLSQERLSESQALLLHSSRVAVVSELAAAFAHELNQPLSAIKMYLRTLQRMTSGPVAELEGNRRLLGDAIAQVDHAAGLIKRTRKFVRRGDSVVRRTNLRNIISTSLSLMNAELRAAGITVHSQLPKSMRPVWANDVQIQQVMVNLLRNAKDAIVLSDPGEKTISIAVEAGSVRAGYVTIRIADTGGGIPSELRESLFEPFATTKEEGLGLGLALCRSILADHGGEIMLDRSSPRTCFVFSLRLVQ
jgi:two-component system sensor kinase FixL